MKAGSDKTGSIHSELTESFAALTGMRVASTRSVHSHSQIRDVRQDLLISDGGVLTDCVWSVCYSF